MEQGNNWTAENVADLGWTSCCASVAPPLRAGGLLACDWFMNFFPALCTPAAAAFAVPGPTPQAASLSHYPKSLLKGLPPHHSFLYVHLRMEKSPLETPMSAWPGESPAWCLAGPQSSQLFSPCSCPVPAHTGLGAGDAAEHPRGGVMGAPPAWPVQFGLNSASLERLE